MFFKNKKILAVSSSRRINGNPYDFNVEVDLPANNNFNRMVILEAQIPKSYYLFNSSDNLNLIITEITGGLAITAVITPGNYDVYTLAVQLEYQLRQASAATGNTLLYTVVYDPLISNFAIYSGNAGEDFDITTTNTTNPYLMRVLGFDNPLPSDMASVGGSLNGNDVVDLERTAEITIRSNMGQNNNTNDIAVLYPDSYASNSMIQYAPGDPYSYTCIMNENRNKVFRFSLYDDQGKLLVLEDAVRLKILCFEE